ncbi:hypothetical protein RSOLAG1IB_08974 [Rhizoctonia solani AG-1 IB]|uniref:Uncharacterized protein n=1 Tax=Thanatephorus cucumeris (strain AG1-IB / isolate 7/3/14) TaxID=1108050 RepID=A0A0B7FLY5_THACB|nr:hypothetical protein RSOLAG1IB_08974 [Rhizoctonia solani AG-1 IB]
MKRSALGFRFILGDMLYCMCFVSSRLFSFLFLLLCRVYLYTALPSSQSLGFMLPFRVTFEQSHVIATRVSARV